MNNSTELDRIQSRLHWAVNGGLATAGKQETVGQLKRFMRELRDEIEPYPELDKISAAQDKSQEIGSFLEWLQTQGYRLAKYVEHTHDKDCWEYADEENSFFHKIWHCDLSEDTENFVPMRFNINELLEQYFEIDGNKAEQERRGLLERIRSQQ